MLAGLPGEPLQGDDAAASILVDMDNDGFLEVRDGWGNVIEYVPGNSHQGDNAQDRYPAKRGPFFCSPGPDGEWGNYTANGGEGNEATRDNYHSFDLD